MRPRIAFNSGSVESPQLLYGHLDAVSFAYEDLSKEPEGNDQGDDGSRCKIIASRLDGSSDYWIQLIGC